MTREEILALAGTLWDEVRDGDDYAVSLFHAAQALEREECAKLPDMLGLFKVAAAIRARGETE